MTFDEYSKQAIKTASCDEVIIVQRISSGGFLNVVHAALGMCSEAGEVFEWVDSPSVLPDYELVAELGDCLWYLNLLVREYEFDTDRIIRIAAVQADDSYDHECAFDNIRLGAEIMATAAGKVSDLIKASIFYGRIMHLGKILHASDEYLSGIILCCRALGITLDEVMDKNIAKLRARYGEVFSEEKANSRDIEKEQEAYSK